MKKIHLKTVALGIVFLLAYQASSAQEGKWINLFDGETLNGWTVHSGYGKYRVEDGCIVGQAVKGSPNTFLCTNREYGDFILEFEVLLEDSELNSGVQFRSQIAPQELVFVLRNEEGRYQSHTIPPDRVYGYQVEISELNSGGAGGVYDEARRAMMPWWPVKGSEESKIFKNGKWNTYRLECRGDSIRTIVNGMVISDFRDAMSLKGIFGLQVHDVGQNTTPYQVRWKNIRIQILD
jgi:3-keto-disaccharide hydrolase